jgi:multiple sugar transport system ATP-binding protein
MAKIVLKDLWKKYGEVEAVKGINMTIDDGEFFCFLGPSGCGKTSTMRMIAGIEEITSGEIWVGDTLVNKLPPSQRNVAMAFETYALYPPLTVRENLAFPIQVRGMPRDQIKTEVERVAKLLDLTDVLDRKPAQLSGGQQQRVSLGRAIVRPAEAYLFDEPLSHVDSKARLRMRAEIKRLQETLNTTSVYVTHDQLEALAIGDRIMVMNFGEIQQIGTPEEIYNQPRNLFVADFIGEPPFNFFDGVLVAEGEQLIFKSEGADTSIPLPGLVREKVAHKTGQAVKLGIRPRFITPSLVEGEGSHIRGTIYVFEDLGEHGVLAVEVDDNLVRLMTDPYFEGKSGDTVWLTFDTAMVHIFDPESGLNLLFAR